MLNQIEKDIAKALEMTISFAVICVQATVILIAWAVLF
jgi:hypothetical protein